MAHECSTECTPTARRLSYSDAYADINTNRNGNLILLPADEARLRLEKVQKQLAGLCDAVIVTDNANTYYFTGRVFSGWA